MYKTEMKFLNIV